MTAERGGTGAGGPGFKWAAKTSVSSLVYSAQTAVIFVRERSAYPTGQRNVDYGCFDGQRKLDHTTERHRRGFKVPMETGSIFRAKFRRETKMK